jgi:citrate synthase
MASDTLTITDNRTGRSYEVPIQYGTYPTYGAAIAAVDLRQIKASDEDFGLLAYDPGFTNTASCRSGITFVDGERGVLRYRGYPIEQLAEQSSFLDTAYLLLNGELPEASERDAWIDDITHHTIVHENIKKFIDGFRHDAHPMGVLVGTVAALSTFYPEAKRIRDEPTRQRQIRRLIAKMPTLAAFSYRHARGLPYAYPDNDLSYTGNFLNMLWKTTELRYEPEPVLEKALERRLSRCSSSCTPTTSRIAAPVPCAAWAALSRIPTRPSRRPPQRCTAHSTEARTKRCCACSRRSVPWSGCLSSSRA